MDQEDALEYERLKEAILDKYDIDQETYHLQFRGAQLQVWIRERNPDSAAEAASLANVFVSARRKTQPWTYAKWKGSRESNKPHRQPPAPKPTSSEALGFACEDCICVRKDKPTRRPESCLWEKSKPI
ncbi:hypothetical protein COCON_G00076230 [Conger conger]|uniref:Uncharacterized protein n=1 Tax=Conger conger TaxID=82655 RepID=A0A9Q1I1H5_CONCO|nr:hypothetical protein COCON_G00076230 [Conger conger]